MLGSFFRRDCVFAYHATMAHSKPMEAVAWLYCDGHAIVMVTFHGLVMGQRGVDMHCVYGCLELQALKQASYPHTCGGLPCGRPCSAHFFSWAPQAVHGMALVAPSTA